MKEHNSEESYSDFIESAINAFDGGGKASKTARFTPVGASKQKKSERQAEFVSDDAYSDFIGSAIDAFDGGSSADEDDDVKIAYFPSSDNYNGFNSDAAGKTNKIEGVGNAEVNFLTSVMNYSSKDVKPRKKKKKTAVVSFFDLLRLMLFCICIGVFAWSIMQIVKTKMDSAAHEKRNNELIELMQNGATQTDPDTGEIIPNGSKGESDTIDLRSDDKISDLISDDNPSGKKIGTVTIDQIEKRLGKKTADKFRSLTQNVEGLKDLNPDTLGWIRVAGTRINYPVMLNNDDTGNDYYLHHDFYREETRAGAIFADYKVDWDYYSNRNVVLYGHCMTDGSMFRAIKLMFDSKNRKEESDNWEVELVTSDCIYIYKIFSGYRSEGARFIQNINRYSCSDSDFENYLNELYRSSQTAFKKDLEFNGESRILTLSTCTNLVNKPDERYVLHCLLVGKINV